MPPVTLTIGAGQIDRIILNADELLREYRNDTGCYYLDYQPITSPNEIVPEDIAVTLLVNSQVGWRAFHSLIEYGHTLDLSQLPSIPLELSSLEDREQITALISKWRSYLDLPPR